MMEQKERFFPTMVSNCKDCKYCNTDTFTMPDETIEKNPFMQPHEYFKTCFYAYCEKECKFIIPVTTYLHSYLSDPIRFPEFCPLPINRENIELIDVCEWFIDTYPEVDDSVDGTLSDIIDIRNKMVDLLEYLERG